MNKKLEKLYEQALLKLGFNWLPGTPPGTYLHSFDEFKQKMESDNQQVKKLIQVQVDTMGQMDFISTKEIYNIINKG